MRIFQDTSIRRKQMLVIMLTSGIVLFLACAAFVVYDTVTFRRELNEQVTILADAVGNNCAAAIDFNDSQAAAETLNALQANANIVSACVYSKDGQVFAVYQRDRGAAFVPPAMQTSGQEFTGDQLRLFRPIRQKNEMTGVIFVASDLKALSARLTRYVSLVGAMFLASLLVALLLSGRFQRLVSAPILDLARVARTVAQEKNYSLRAAKHGDDEIGQLVDGFNEMLEQIQQRGAALQAALDEMEARVVRRTTELARTNDALKIENAGRRQAEETLRSSREEFKDLFDNAPVGFHEVDADGRLVRINNTELKMLGYSAGELLGQFVWKFSADEEATRQNVLALLRGERTTPQDFERSFRRQDGSIFPVMISARLLKREDGAIIGLRAAVQDITEQKRAELALRESQALYHSLVEQMPAGVFRKDRAGRYVFVNSRFCQIHGLESDGQMLGRTADDFAAMEEAAHGQSRPEILQRLRTGSRHHEEILRTGKPIHVEEVHDLAGGGKRYLQVVKSAVFDSDGRIVGTQGMQFDITERKQAETARENERALLRTLIDLIPDMIYVRDTAHRFLIANRSITQHMVGANAGADALLGKTDADFYPAETAAIYADNDRRVFAGNKIIEEEASVDFPNGERRTVLSTKVPLKNIQGEVIGLVGVIRDITERKKAEAELDYERNLLRMMLDNSPDHIYFKDAQSRFTKASETLARQFGVSSPEDTVGKTDFDFFEEAHARPAFEDEQEIIRTGQAVIDKEEREVWKDGHVTWASSTKMPMRDKAGKIIGIMGVSRDITERKLVEAELNRERTLWRSLLDTSPDAIYFKDTQSRFIKTSQAHAKLFGVKSPDDLVGKTDFDFFTDEHARPAFESEQEIIRTGQPIIGREDREVWKDGRVTWASSTKIAMRDDTGKIVGTMGISRDITERKRLEEHLIQSQKMETVGKLAGGIAHEFNSILTAIIGQSELLIQDLPAGSPPARSAAEISRAADRAAGLTRQLLAYGRKQFLRPEALNLNQVITGMTGVLNHLMGGEIVDVNIVPAAGLKPVKADAGQIEQVIINLAMNAHEAMPGGGKFTLETANVSLGPEYVSRFPDLKAGDYVMLAVTDTGRGMSEPVKARAFEPFFTTKDVGQGTGLGLSTCYGIVKQSGGHINVYSEPGRGTTFKIYLPPMEPAAKIPNGHPVAPDLPRGTETILLVEDDPALREMAATLLRRLGYTVLEAANGIEALRLKQQGNIGHIDLLFTDVVMPHMSGKELSDRMRASFPHTRILFTSAYTENAIVHQGVLDKGVALLQKPFTPAAMAFKVREALDQPVAPPPASAPETSGGSTPPGS